MMGMIRPETNWAPKLARNSSSFSASKVASVSRRRPNTVASSWPVNASSIWAFSRPVRRHWSTNSPWERPMTARLTSSVSGTVTRATSARVGEMTSIIATTPTTVSSDVSSWLIVCCSVWLMLSMSLVTRLSSSPRGWAST